MNPHTKKEFIKTETDKSPQQNIKNKPTSNFGMGTRNQAQRVTITAVVAISAVCILMVVAAWWYESHKTTNIACNTDTNCILAYTGNQSCTPCDYADADYRCVSSDQAKKLQEKKFKEGIRCKLCSMSPLLYRCTCQGKAEKVCIKTANCDTDDDCITNSFNEGQYKCINNKCSYLATTNINTNTNINVVCDETLCAKYRYGNCPAGCEEHCTPSSCADTPQGRVCTADCNGPGSCACPFATNTNTTTTNTNTSTDNKYCAQDSDCGLLMCGGCFSKEYLKTAPADLPCATYNGYSCQCVKNRCLEINPDRPYDFTSIKDEADCLALGAEWVSVGMTLRCEMPAPDAGKICTKASDCIRICGVENVNESTGSCAAHSGSGCYRYLDEAGKLGMVCVD